jgi:hypothetical protein
MHVLVNTKMYLWTSIHVFIKQVSKIVISLILLLIIWINNVPEKLYTSQMVLHPVTFIPTLHWAITLTVSIHMISNRHNWDICFVLTCIWLLYMYMFYLKLFSKIVERLKRYIEAFPNGIPYWFKNTSWVFFLIPN